MNDLEKFNTIKVNKLCYNCFKGDHFTSKCKSKITCFKKSFMNISRKIKGIEVRKEERKILNKIQTSKGKSKKFSQLQASPKSLQRRFLCKYYH